MSYALRLYVNTFSVFTLHIQLSGECKEIKIPTIELTSE